MRIALVAMSGVRAYNPELTKLGMTLPGFVERGRTIAMLPSLSLLTLAAITPDRHEVSYHEVSDIADVGELPECDLAAISSYSAQVKEAYELSRRFRCNGTTTVLGGLHVTALPLEAAQHCDAVVVGEGEVAWPSLLEDFEAGRLHRVYTAIGDEYELSSGPIPRYELLDAERYNRLTVQTQRGCPWHCEFCASSILLTPRYKLKPAHKVLAEIRAIKSIWPRPFVEFADDNTFVNKHHSRRLMEAVAGENIHWFTETDISVADDPELLAMMKDAGCAEVLIGFESPNPDGLDGLELKRNWKRAQIDRYATAIETIQSHGIAVNACFVLGLDGDGPEVFDAVEKFVDDTVPFDVQITVMTAFPGTPLYHRLRAEGRILEPGAWEKCTLFDVNIKPLRMSVAELERGLVELGKHLYSTEATRLRRAGFRDQWRAGRAQRRRAEVPA